MKSALRLLGSTVKRRAVMVCVVGIALGSLTGIAYGAYYSHSANGWSHGIDGYHVWMSKTNSTPDEGVVAWIYRQYTAGGYLTQHSYETRYTATHVHENGCASWDCETIAGHFSSPSPYLSHHQHP